MAPAAPPLRLPAAYLSGFAAAPMPGEQAASVWAFRAAIGEWRRWPVLRAPGPERHFNDADPAFAGLGPLWDEQEELGTRIAPFLGDGLAAERPVAREDREAFARWLGLLGVRSARHGAELSLEEARAGAAALAGALQEMGWVFWIASPPHHFVGSSSPFHAAFPKAEASQTTGFDLTAPQVELTFALSPRVALHATWRRKGELWRRAREEVLLEINGRTCASAATFLVSPLPSVPG